MDALDIHAFWSSPSHFCLIVILPVGYMLSLAAPPIFLIMVSPVDFAAGTFEGEYLWAMSSQRSLSTTNVSVSCDTM